MEPLLPDAYLSQLTTDEPIPSEIETLEDFRANSESFITFRYDPPTHTDIDRTTSDKESTIIHTHPDVVVEIKFDEEAMSQIILSSSQKDDGSISKNDLIHAILLKICTLNPTMPEDAPFKLSFACDMRSRCGIPPNVIGNIVAHPSYTLSAGTIRSTPLIALARLNRTLGLSLATSSFFCKRLLWYTQLKRFKEPPLHYHTVADSYTTTPSNWASFNYSDLRFGQDATFACILPYEIARFGVNVITPDWRSGKHLLRTSVVVPYVSLELLTHLQSENPFFTFEQLK